MKTDPFNVITLSREDFDRIETKPDYYLFFVLDKIVKDGNIVNVYSLYKGSVQVGVGDIIQSLPDSMRAANGGFRASAFAKSESKPAKPRESDFADYNELVNSRGAWQPRPDNLVGDGQIWVSFHWFTGSPAEALDTGDEWTDPVRLTGLNGADGRDGRDGADGRDGRNGADGKNGKDGADGTGVFIRFNSAVSIPERPTGMGIDGGWSSNQKADSRWISMKQGQTAGDGKWGEPVQIRCNLIRYDSSDGSIRDEFGNFLGLAFSPVYTIDTEQVIPLTVQDRYKFDTQEPLRVNCYVSTPQGTRSLLNPGDYSLMCKVRDNRTTPAQETTFELEYANREWLLPLEDWYDKSNTTDFIELHLFKKDDTASSVLSIKLIQLVRDGEAGKITSVRAETLAPGSQATVRNEGDEHDARLVFGIPRGDKGEQGMAGADGKDGFGVFYTTVSYDTTQAAQISRQFIRNEGKMLQTGDFIIEASDNKHLFRISQLTADYAYCDHIGILKGIKGDTGNDGLGIFLTDEEWTSEYITSDISHIATWGRDIHDGDLVVSKHDRVYQIDDTASNDGRFGCRYKGSVRGEKGEKGEKGDKGDPFMIRKTYTSVEEMNADFGNTEVPTHGMVLIDTGNVEDEDNAKLYVKGETGFSFLTDLSGAQGIKGDTGFSFRKGDVGSVSGNGDAVFTYVTPSQGLQAGDIIVGFNEALGIHGKLFRLSNAVNLTGTDLGVSLRGAQGVQGEQGKQGIQGVQGKTGFGTYRTGANMTAIEADYSLQKSEVETFGRDLQVGDFIIEGSEDSYLWRVKEIPDSGTAVQCEYICSLRGTPGARGPQGEKGDTGPAGERGPQGLQGPTGDTGEKGPQGQTGTQGLGTYRISQSLTSTSYSGLAISTYFPAAVLNGRTLLAGDLFIEASVNSYLYRITAVTGSTFNATRLASLRGATGATGPAGAAGKDAPTLDSQTAWKLIRSLGDSVCLSTSAADRALNNGRGGTRSTDEEAVFFILKSQNGYEGLVVIGRTQSSVTLTNLTSYASNTITTTGECLYINLCNLIIGAWPNHYGVNFYKNGSSSVTRNYGAFAQIPVDGADAADYIKGIYISHLLMAGASAWRPNASTSFSGLMAPADKAKLDGMIGIVAAGYYDSNGNGNGTTTFGSCIFRRITEGSYSISNIGASDIVVAMPFSSNADILVKPYKRSQTATIAYVKATSLSAPTTVVDTSFFFAVIKTV